MLHDKPQRFSQLLSEWVRRQQARARNEKANRGELRSCAESLSRSDPNAIDMYKFQFDILRLPAEFSIEAGLCGSKGSVCGVSAMVFLLFIIAFLVFFFANPGSAS
ncbi:hypothetical protein R1sor_010722 [Riccia sorocarpa]|uniref:Uncharacterized protein n=1 Tax=Riccia sorocarpa TaxID=122646 RepID=A0ABD3I099_9MARC